jgi:hypothetical protein
MLSGFKSRMIVVYLVLIELGKRRFYRLPAQGPPIAHPHPDRERGIHHRATRWSTHTGPRRQIPTQQP